ncbi:MAG: hypothetical protein EHM48_08015 [Planctomycetaceae bacterium]|nr:MAG: hypothetical protein EHM48_08015 [Planctomycetaceae bacterium]
MKDAAEIKETNMSQDRPKLMGPRRRWWILGLWLLLLLAVLISQRATVHSFNTGHWTPSGNTDSTEAELLWYRLPVAGIVVIAVVFFIGLRWWVPEKGTRGIIRAWGIMASFMSLLISVGMSLWFMTFYFYMD